MIQFCKNRKNLKTKTYNLDTELGRLKSYKILFLKTFSPDVQCVPVVVVWNKKPLVPSPPAAILALDSQQKIRKLISSSPLSLMWALLWTLSPWVTTTDWGRLLGTKKKYPNGNCTKIKSNSWKRALRQTPPQTRWEWEPYWDLTPALSSAREPSCWRECPVSTSRSPPPLMTYFKMSSHQPRLTRRRRSNKLPTEIIRC